MLNQIVNGIIAAVLLLVAALAFFNGFMAAAAAETIMQQIYAALYFMISGILVATALILSQIAQLNRSANYSDEVSKLMLDRLTKLNDDMEELKADSAWFRDLRRKELAAAKARKSPPVPPNPPTRPPGPPA